jgi:hypothetical protein
VPDLTGAAASGDRIKALRSLRDRLAIEIDECNSDRDLTGLGKLFVDVVNAIESAGGGGKATVEDETFDELAKRRAARGADAAGGARPAGG